MKTLQILSVLFCLIGLCLAAGDWMPQQIHLSYGESPDEMVVTWVTINMTDSSDHVDFGLSSLDQTQNSSISNFLDYGEEQRQFWVHRAHMTELEPDSKYIYEVGSSYGMSSTYSFKTLKSGSDYAISLAVYGDLGVENAQSLDRLLEETQQGEYDAIFHAGDFAYDLETNNSRVGDAFMNIIQPMAANFPYMVCPGNHEFHYNFANYIARFSMPGYAKTKSLWYSFNMGPVHFVVVSTEVYYYLQYGVKPLIRQWAWLEADLLEANLPPVRSQRPWIILIGHRPMYCSNNGFTDCRTKIDAVRNGVPFKHWFGMEKLFAQYGVDVAIWAHEHAYERLWPIYNFEIRNGSVEEPYTNPQGTVHVTSGSAGCDERIDEFADNQPYWSALRSEDYGYMKFKVFNNTHLHFEQISDDQDGAVVDSVDLIKDDHGPYPETMAEGD